MILNNPPQLSVNRIIDLCLTLKSHVKDIEEYGYEYQDFDKEQLIEMVKLLFIEAKKRQNDVRYLNEVIEKYETLLEEHGIEHDTY